MTTALAPLPYPDPGSDTRLRRLVESTSGTGQAYFDQLVVNLARELDVRFAFVSEIRDTGPVRTLALCDNGEILPEFKYELPGTPCERAIREGVSFVPRDAAGAFPDDPYIPELGIESYVGLPLRGADGRILGVLALMDDKPLGEPHAYTHLLTLFAARTATEIRRQRAEAEVERQRSFNEELLDQVDALVLLLDEAGHILSANRTVTQVTGWSEAELLGRRLCATFACESARTAIRAAMSSRIPMDVEDVWTTPDGQERQIRWQIRPLDPGDRESSARLLVTGLDLTALESTRRERDALQERLRRTRRLESLGRLAGGVAHDFNNLLLAILGYADIIESDPESVDEVLASSAEIRRAADHAAVLTRQLLAFGRRQRLDRQAIDLTDVVRDATAVLRPLLPPSIHVITDLPDEPISVTADPSRLEQVLVNLGANARDAMPGGGSLYLKVRAVDRGASPTVLNGRAAAMIEVSDSGTGIDPSVLPHIFEPFFTTKDLGQGTGLGLASVYGTVQQHGGNVDVETRPGQGTTFRVYLPMDARPPTPRAKSRVLSPKPGAGRRILVAEDDHRVRKLVSRLLQAAGYRVDAYPDGAAAWAAFEQAPAVYDLVLADVLMPRVGGIELASRVRAHHPNTPIMLTSGFVADPSEFPIDVRLLPKPYMPDDLLAAVGAAVGAERVRA